MNSGRYDAAQICLNGHVINSTATAFPLSNENFCSTCGEKTITQCPSCHTNIRGEYYHPELPPTFGNYQAPAFCIECGKAYPWTESRQEAAIELAYELEGLSAEDKEQLKSSIPELLKEGPRTALAESRYKRIMKKVGSEGAQVMQSILVDVVSETIRKSVFGV